MRETRSQSRVTGMARTTITTGLIVSAVLTTSQSAGQAPATAEELTLDRESVRCISAGAIRETDVIDDQTIVFRLRNGDYYLNILNSACWSLEREGRFSFSTPSGRLCSSDMINVIQPFTGSANAAGCGLRRFFPLTETEAELLGIEESERRGGPQMEVENPNEREESEE